MKPKIRRIRLNRAVRSGKLDREQRERQTDFTNRNHVLLTLTIEESTNHGT